VTNNVYANQSDALEMERLRRAGHCTDCGEHMDVCDCDPTPWCHGCGAVHKKDCECGPIAEND